ADAYVRLFDATGHATGDEYRINSGSNPCANPAVSVAAGGGFVVAWSQKGSVLNGESWDVYARCFNSSSTPLASDIRLNSNSYGDQFAPKLSSIGSDFFVVWTSIDQDGSREGVFGRFLSSATGSLVGEEIRVNTSTIGQQMHPAVSSDGNSRFLVVWTSFVGGNASFDVMGQRYALSQALPTPAAPFVYAPFELDSNGVYLPQL